MCARRRGGLISSKPSLHPILPTLHHSNPAAEAGYNSLAPAGNNPAAAVGEEAGSAAVGDYCSSSERAARGWQTNPALIPLHKGRTPAAVGQGRNEG